jgi:hypothetical protein
MRKVFLCGLAAAGLSCGSGSSGSSPTAPSPTQNQTLATFTDPTTGQATSDVRDVDEQVMRFEMPSGVLSWIADGSRHSGWPVSGNFLDSAHQFQVRFGSRSGQRRAYFTESGSGTICQLETSGGQLRISATSERP